MWFFIAFLIMPVIEIRLFVWIAAQIGLMPTILLCVLMAVIGTTIIRIQGFKTLMTAQESMMRHEMPARTLFDGLCLTMAGILLIIPGFFTDILGFLLLAPQVRAHLFKIMDKHY